MNCFAPKSVNRLQKPEHHKDVPTLGGKRKLNCRKKVQGTVSNAV